MKPLLPDPQLLQRTSDVDYYHWNYQFPIKYIQTFRFKALLDLMGSNTYGKLLEVGTGSGIFLPELSHHARELYACDIHNNMDVVKQLCEYTSIEAQLKKCSIEDTGYPDDFFDIIVSVSVLEFVKDLRKALIEVKRILRNGGFFLTICPQKNLLGDFVLYLYIRKNPEEEFENPRSQVSSMLEKYFKVVTKKIFPPVVGRVLPFYFYYKLTK